MLLVIVAVLALSSRLAMASCPTYNAQALSSQKENCQSWGDPHVQMFQTGMTSNCHELGRIRSYLHINTGLTVEAQHEQYVYNNNAAVQTAVYVYSQPTATGTCAVSPVVAANGTIWVAGTPYAVNAFTSTPVAFSGFSAQRGASDAEVKLTYAASNTEIVVYWWSALSIWNVYISVPSMVAADGGVEGTCTNSTFCVPVPVQPPTFGGAVNSTQADRACVAVPLTAATGFALRIRESCVFDVGVTDRVDTAIVAVETAAWQLERLGSTCLEAAADDINRKLNAAEPVCAQCNCACAAFFQTVADAIQANTVCFRQLGNAASRFAALQTAAQRCENPNGVQPGGGSCNSYASSLKAPIAYATDRSCTLWGDPHIQRVDGTWYDCQTFGTKTVLKHNPTGLWITVNQTALPERPTGQVAVIRNVWITSVNGCPLTPIATVGTRLVIGGTAYTVSQFDAVTATAFTGFTVRRGLKPVEFIIVFSDSGIELTLTMHDVFAIWAMTLRFPVAILNPSLSAFAWGMCVNSSACYTDADTSCANNNGNNGGSTGGGQPFTPGAWTGRTTRPQAELVCTPTRLAAGATGRIFGDCLFDVEVNDDATVAITAMDAAALVAITADPDVALQCDSTARGTIANQVSAAETACGSCNGCIAALTTALTATRDKKGCLRPAAVTVPGQVPALAFTDRLRRVIAQARDNCGWTDNPVTPTQTCPSIPRGGRRFCYTYGDPHWINVAGKPFECHTAGWATVYANPDLGVLLRAEQRPWMFASVSFAQAVNVNYDFQANCSARVVSLDSATNATSQPDLGATIDGTVVLWKNLVNTRTAYRGLTVSVQSQVAGSFSIRFEFGPANINVTVSIQSISARVNTPGRALPVGTTIYAVIIDIIPELPATAQPRESGLCLLETCALDQIKDTSSSPGQWSGTTTREQAVAACGSLPRVFFDSCMFDVEVYDTPNAAASAKAVRDLQLQLQPTLDVGTTDTSAAPWRVAPSVVVVSILLAVLSAFMPLRE